MESIKLTLIDKTKVSTEEVLCRLRAQKCGTLWAEKTNYWAVDCAQHLGDKHGEVWWKGILNKELIGQILLPNHGHSLGEGKDNIVFFPNNTRVADALSHIENFGGTEATECLRCIEHLKQEIKSKGFNTELFLAVTEDGLTHVDGLHRMIALQILISEGHALPDVPVFLCDSLK